MRLYDYHWIGKGCTVEVLYGEQRSFNGIIKEFDVVGVDLTKPQTMQGLNHYIVNVYGDMQSICQCELKLLKKPGYTKVREGEWVADYLIKSDER